MTGVYSITNKINNKVLIGCGKSIRKRLNHHKCLLRKGKHNNQRLQHSWNKYGEENFIFETLEECEEQYIFSQENYWCIMTNSHDDRYGYNIKPTGPTESTTISEETREKLRKINKGKKFSDEVRKKISDSSKGRKPSEKVLQIFKYYNENKVVSDTTLKKMSESMMGEKNPNYGKKTSEEKKAKIRESLNKYYQSKKLFGD